MIASLVRLSIGSTRLSAPSPACTAGSRSCARRLGARRDPARGARVRGQSRRARRRLGVGIADAPWGGEARQADGFILQAVLPDESRRWFLRQGQPLKEALREVCAVL